MRGALSTVWFDRYKISRFCPEHLESIDSMCQTLGALIQDQVKAGVPAHRIIVGRDSALELSKGTQETGPEQVQLSSPHVKGGRLCWGSVGPPVSWCLLSHRSK